MDVNEKIVMYEKEIKALRHKIESSESHKLYLEADRKRSLWFNKYEEIKEENILLKKKCLKKQKYIDKLKKDIAALIGIEIN